MNSRAGPLNASIGTPAIDMNMPFAAVPDSSIVDCVREAVGREQLDVTVVRPEHRDLVLDHLRAVLVDQAAEEDRVGARST